jgi:hypothetical protein
MKSLGPPGSTGKLMARAVGERLCGRGPGRRHPTRPIIEPAAGDAIPLRGHTVDSHGAHAIGHERVVFALQAVLVLHDVGVPGIARLDIEPPRAGVDVLTVRIAERIQASVVAIVVAIVVGEAVVIARGADLRAVGVEIDGLIVPAGIDVEVDAGEPRRLLRQAGVLAVARPITHPGDAKARGARRAGAAVGPGHVIAGGPSGIRWRRWRRWRRQRQAGKSAQASPATTAAMSTVTQRLCLVGRCISFSSSQLATAVAPRCFHPNTWLLAFGGWFTVGAPDNFIIDALKGDAQLTVGGKPLHRPPARSMALTIDLVDTRSTGVKPPC